MSGVGVAAYAAAAQKAGVPRDQFVNLLRAQVVLQTKQLLASAAARQCDHEGGPTHVGYGGARGGGKSHWMLAQMAVDDCQRFAGLKCLLLRKVGKAGTESFEDLRVSVLANTPHKFNASKNIVTFPNGSRIVLGNYQNDRDVEKYLGLEYDIIGIEEATTLLAKKIKMIQTCCRTSKSGWRPRLYYTTNPGGVGHAWFYKQFVKLIDSRSRFIQATVRDNKFVNREYIEVLESLVGWQRDAWLDGRWDIAAGQYFSTWDEETHVIEPVKDFWPVEVWGSFDYGYTHNTVFYLFGKDGDGNVYTMAEHVAHKKLPSFHAAEIIALLARFQLKPSDLKQIAAGHDCWMKGRDEKGLTTAEQYSNLGLEFTKAKIDRINGASEMLTRLGDPTSTPAQPPRWFIYNTCPRLIECIPFLIHDPNRPEDVLKVDADDEGNDGDDPYDAARYGVMVDYHPPQSLAAGAYISRGSIPPPYVPR